MNVKKADLSLECKRSLEIHGMSYAVQLPNFDLKALILFAAIEKLILFSNGFKTLTLRFLHYEIYRILNSSTNPFQRQTFTNFFEIFSSCFIAESSPDLCLEILQRAEFHEELQYAANNFYSLEYLSESLSIEILLFTPFQYETNVINCSNYLTQLRISILKFEDHHYICYTDEIFPVFPNIVHGNILDLKEKALDSVLCLLSECIYNHQVKNKESIRNSLRNLWNTRYGKCLCHKAVNELLEIDIGKNNGLKLCAVDLYSIIDLKKQEPVKLIMKGLYCSRNIVGIKGTELKLERTVQIKLPDLDFTQQIIEDGDDSQEEHSIDALLHNVEKSFNYKIPEFL